MEHRRAWRSARQPGSGPERLSDILRSLPRSESRSPLAAWRIDHHELSLWILAEQTADILYTRDVGHVARTIRMIELGHESPSCEIGRVAFSALHDMGYRDAECLREAQKRWYAEQCRREPRREVQP